MTLGGDRMNERAAQERLRHRSTHIQMDLPFYPAGSLHHALGAYLAHQTEGLAEATLSDYRDRSKWLIGILGPGTPLTAITYLRLERVAREYGLRSSQRGLMDVTIKRRLVFLRAAMRYAAMCGYFPRDSIPELPRLKDDGLARRSYHTIEQWRGFRAELAPGPTRRFADLGMWTGHHTHDLESFEWWMLDPERPITDGEGQQVGVGMFWRRNHKNKRSTGVWFPMEPEFREIVLGWFADGQCGDAAAKVVGKVWNKHKSFAVACDRAGAPRVSPIDLRRSYATTLVGRGYPHEYVRQALGHEGETSRTAGGATGKPSTASRHYLVAGPALWSQWSTAHPPRLPANDTQ